MLAIRGFQKGTARRGGQNFVTMCRGGSHDISRHCMILRRLMTHECQEVSYNIAFCLKVVTVSLGIPFTPSPFRFHRLKGPVTNSRKCQGLAFSEGTFRGNFCTGVHFRIIATWPKLLGTILFCRGSEPMQTPTKKHTHTQNTPGKSRFTGSGVL